MRSLKGGRRWRVAGGILGSAGLALALTLPGLRVGTAAADPIVVLQNSQTGLCLAGGTANGSVYTTACGGGAQAWGFVVDPGGYVSFINGSNFQCLESNSSGGVFTENCTGGTAQEWATDVAPDGGVGFCDVDTRLCLESNSSGNVYTDQGNGDSNQSWDKGLPI
jgi:hypothetical protein